MNPSVLRVEGAAPKLTATRILDAAEAVFSEHGYTGASTREIARRARVPFGALHYHWGTKRRLWDAVFRRLADRTRETIIGSFTPGDTIGTVLDNLADAFLDFFVAHRQIARLCYTAALESAELHREIHAMIAELQALGRELLAGLTPPPAVDTEVAIVVVTNAFLASVVDEGSQTAFMGGSVFASLAARERLRAELKRIARAVFAAGPCQGEDGSER
jgi:AcrR family transcriptional regulator